MPKRMTTAEEEALQEAEEAAADSGGDNRAPHREGVRIGKFDHARAWKKALVLSLAPPVLSLACLKRQAGRT